MLKRWFSLVLLIILITGWMPISPVRSQYPMEPKVVLVDASDPDALREVEASGGVLLAEYEAASLWRVPGRFERNQPQTALVQVDDAILLRGITLQPSSGLPAVPRSLQQSIPTGPSLWIVQFAGPVLPEWLDSLMAAGFDIVAYLPNNAFIVWGEQSSARLQTLSAGDPSIVWQGAYHPYYRLAPELRPDQDRSTQELGEMVDVTVQLYQTEAVSDTIARLEARAEAVLSDPFPVSNLINVRVRVPTADLVEIASWANVLNIEPYIVPQLMDEAQGQILAGNVSSPSGDVLLPAGPGYLDWLNAKGFPTVSTQYPIVDIMDDGLDSGNVNNVLHPDFYVNGIKPGDHRIAYLKNCTSDDSGNGVGGHGNLNAGIVGGYNASGGPAYQDADGYSYGLGISPYGRIASTKIFNDDREYDLDRCSKSLEKLVQNAYSAGSRITSNSWGAKVYGAYTTDSQLYDFLTRDASFVTDGNQEMFHIFSAGNEGPYAETIVSPGTAKNVLTVGATENVRDEGVMDGCGEINGNNAADMAEFSSRGPTADGRIKPDMVAPGTHVMGPASQDPGYNGTGVCGQARSWADFTNSEKFYYPTGQTLYTWSTGTSHSTPAVAGIAQLNYNYYQRVLQPGAVPSPAMQKALLINTPRYLTGNSTYDTLPSSNQGWGMPDMSAMTDGVPRILKDQEHIFRSSGQSPYQITGTIADSSKPFKVSLVWTDAPGNPTAGVSAVNNLNLEVVAGGQVYRGNVFNKNVSISGGSHDTLNNVENVYLPAGLSGPFRIRVYPHTIAGDGVYNNGWNFDQDFALVVYNGAEAANIPVLTLDSFSVQQVTGNDNGALDPGETFSVQVGLENIGTAATEPVTAALSTTDLQTKVSNVATAPAIARNSSQTLSPGFQVAINVVHRCAGVIPLSLNLTHGPYEYSIPLPDLQIGTTNLISQTFTAPDLPVFMPNDQLARVTLNSVPITIPQGVRVEDLDVHISIDHGYTSDLRLVLVHPTGLSAILTDQIGGSGSNYSGTIFDDEASTFIFHGLPPYTGRYKPEASLSIFDGIPGGGTWNLEIYDFFASEDPGTLTDFTLVFQYNSPQCSIVGTKEEIFLPSIHQ